MVEIQVIYENGVVILALTFQEFEESLGVEQQTAVRSGERDGDDMHSR
jgi:hypothetical protein